MEDCGQIWHKLATIVGELQEGWQLLYLLGWWCLNNGIQFACCGMQPFCINMVAQIFPRKLEALTLGPLLPKSILLQSV